MATVLILGGGVGGLVAANVLRRQLDRSHRIILVDREPRHVFTSSFLWMMLGWRQPDQISRDLKRLERKGIEVAQEEIREIDPKRHSVRTAQRELQGDYLITALGAEGWLGGVPGLAESGYNLYELDGTLRLREALSSLREGRVAVLISSLPFRCPAAPYEAAMLIEASLRARGIRRQTQVDMYTPEPLPMPVAGKQLGEAVTGILGQKGIGYHPQHKVTAVDPAQRTLTFENGARAAYDLLVITPPHRCPSVVREAGLVGETGYVPVDAHTLQTGHERVFALGDVTAIKLPAGPMLPKAGVFAHAQAEVVAHNVAAEINGEARRKSFEGMGYCIVEMGDGIATSARGDFYAEPAPAVRLRQPSRLWHWGKIAFEKWWLWRWF